MGARGSGFHVQTMGRRQASAGEWSEIVSKWFESGGKPRALRKRRRSPIATEIFRSDLDDDDLPKVFRVAGL